MPCVFPKDTLSALPRSVYSVRLAGRTVIVFSFAMGVHVTSTHPAQARCPSFTAPISYTAGTSPRSAAIGDLNGDGHPAPAIATSHPATMTIVVCCGDLNDDGVFDGLDIQELVNALLEGKTCP